MKKIQYFSYIVIISMLAFACSDDFLQKNSLTEISNETAWTTPQDAAMGLAACYDALQSSYLYGGDAWTLGQLNMECMTDNGGHFNWSGWMAGYDIANGIHSPSSWAVGSYWQASYEAIKRFNDLIFHIDHIEMDQTEKEFYKAEALALRALIYTNLTMTYQDVPFITKPQDFSEANLAKTARAEIVAAIMEDLNQAIAALPVQVKSRGHVSRGAALAIQGRLALYNEEWDTAISAYRQIMTLGVYGLHDDYHTLFTQAGESSNEIIFGVRYEGPGLGEGSAFAAHWDTPMEAMNGTLDLANAYYCTDGLPIDKSPLYTEGVNDLENNKPDAQRFMNRDLRLKATLFVPGMKWGNSNAEFYGGASPSYSTVYVYKYFDPYQSSSDSWDSGQDFYVVRYPEVLLSLAEALVEKGGYQFNEVADLVNQVRARAQMPSVQEVEGTALSQAELLDVIKHERRVETAFEGLRLFDLYRWKELDQAVANIEKERTSNPKVGLYFNYEVRNFRGEQEYVWPIPLHEMDTNDKLEQHPLWK